VGRKKTFVLAPLQLGDTLEIDACAVGHTRSSHETRSYES
jgi:hypothetical protein